MKNSGQSKNSENFLTQKLISSQQNVKGHRIAPSKRLVNLFLLKLLH